MKEQDNKIDFTYYLDLFWRRKWYVISSLFTILIVGLLYCLTAPKIYKASTTISIIRPRVPESFVRSTVTAGIDERIHSIGEEILSRTKLEQVITELNLYPEERKKLFMEVIIERMRESISIEVARGAHAFTISYLGRSPQEVPLVANTLASIFMEEHLKLREEHAKGTSEFLADELRQLEAQLREREDVVSRYKMSHMGELPTQMQANLSVLARLQQQLTGVQESIGRAQDSKLIAQQQMQIAGAYNPVENEPPGGLEDTSLQQLKDHLAALESKYTTNHPDVLKTKKMIEKVEEKLAAEGSRDDAGKGGEVKGRNPLLEGFQYQVAAIDMEIEKLKSEAAALKQELALYQRRIENVPRREQEMSDLQRDYSNLNVSFNQLLAKRLEAERAENLERRQKGEQFRILDPARVPELPYKPNIPFLLAMTVISALGGAVGSAFMRESIDKSFYRIENIESFLKLPVLASIPMIMTAEDIKRQKRQKLLALSSISCGIVVVSLLLISVIRKYPGWI